jgi:HD-GYP domain-containing protein (c-di-GMP phosphodiesterase class II)
MARASGDRLQHAAGGGNYTQDLLRAISMMNAAITNSNLYAPSHPQVLQYLDKVHAALSSLLATRPEITLLVIGNDVVADNQPLSAAGSSGAFLENFCRILKKKSVERLSFLAGMPQEDLQAIIGDLAAGPAVPVRTRPFIKIGRVEVRVRSAGTKQATTAAPAGAAAGVPSDVLEELQELTASELDELKELYHRIKKHKQINVRGIEDIVKGFVRSFRQEVNPLSILASLKSSHEYTFTHVANVGILTMSQAESMGFTGEHLHQIGVASLLHDVGKLFIPEEILNKPGKLSDDERKIMETHTVKGARYLTGLEGIPKLAVLAALEHHIKFDGSGYPNVRGGWKPNIVSQIISVSDVFDAMRSKRTYQEAHSVEKIESVLRGGSGKAFNPLLVDHFLRLIKK